MSIKYDEETDTLYLFFSPPMSGAFEYAADDFAVAINETGALQHIIIQKAEAFVAQARAAGVEIETDEKLGQPVWEDVQSSMIAAFKYDESAQTLSVIFNRTGIQQYFNVPPKVIQGLRRASSKGSYMRYAIIDQFPEYQRR